MIETTQNESLHEKYADQLPREKLLEHGVQALSKRDLVAILLGTGMKGLNVLDLADEILQSVSYNLDTLARYDVKQIIHLFKGRGIGEAKAITLVAAIELGSRRIGDRASAEVVRFTSSKSIFDYMYPKLMNLAHEECHILLLNNANKIISTHMLSKGGISATVIDVRMLMRHVLMQSATSVAVCHNHPSGNMTPSAGDIKVTEQIVGACSAIGVQFLDHIIIGNNEYFSFLDEGLI